MMFSFMPRNKLRSVCFRDLHPGDRVMIDNTAAIVSKVEWSDDLIYYKKTARAMRISFLDHRSITAHPGAPIKLSIV
jgi:hypothetical protein